MGKGTTNKAMLIGNLGADPESRFTPDGVAVTNIRMATTETWKDKSGEKQERTEWHRVVFWRQLAEIAGQYLKKGSKIYVEGKLQTREWEDKEGKKCYTTEIVGNEMEMLDSKPQSDQSGTSRQSHPSSAPPPVPADSGDEDDLPF